LLGGEARGERRETSIPSSLTARPSSLVPPSSSLVPRPSSLRLMTIRSEGQFNTVVYEDYDLYRGVERRNVILLHPDDINALRLTAGQRVRVKSAVGEMANIIVHEFPDIRPGNAAMYYPECNILVSRALDPQSKTPAFKGVVIRVAR